MTRSQRIAELEQQLKETNSSVGVQLDQARQPLQEKIKGLEAELANVRQTIPQKEAAARQPLQEQVNRRLLRGELR